MQGSVPGRINEWTKRGSRAVVLLEFCEIVYFLYYTLKDIVEDLICCNHQEQMKEGTVKEVVVNC